MSVFFLLSHNLTLTIVAASTDTALILVAVEEFAPSLVTDHPFAATFGVIGACSLASGFAWHPP